MQSRLFDRMSAIDVGFDFTTDTRGYWDGFWEKRGGLGISDYDPDRDSPRLREYHRILWSRELPNGETMELENAASRSDYLVWRGHRFGSDSITASFRYKRNRTMIKRVAASMDDYRGFMEDYLHRCYTIGGCIIIPKWHGGMNQSRGTNRAVMDRWDRTLECIRIHHEGGGSPLTRALETDRWFYDLFVDFRGYVDFFLLQDCVTPDYSEVVPWVGDLDFETPALPGDVDEYMRWMGSNLDFVERRNARIHELTRTVQSDIE